MSDKERSTEHVMLYSDLEEMVRKNSMRLTIRKMITFLRGTTTVPSIGDYTVVTGDIAHHEKGHAYFLSFAESAEPKDVIPLVVTREYVGYIGEPEAVVDDGMMRIARFILNNAVWESAAEDDGQTLP